MSMEQIKEALLKEVREPKKETKRVTSQEWVWTGIEGFDKLLETGIPRGTSTLVCGGPGSGKTIFCLQVAKNAAERGEKVLYMTFEEAESRLKKHMQDFGWEPDKLIKDKKLLIHKFEPFDVTRQVEAMLEKAKGELLIDVKPMLFPDHFRPDWVVVDSLSAIASAFVGKEETYRIYIEQLFRLLEESKATSLLISESTEPQKRLTVSGVEEFLADGVVVMYNIQHGNVRESGLEVLKMRGASFEKKTVAFQIRSGEGITVYPEQELLTS